MCVLDNTQNTEQQHLRAPEKAKINLGFGYNSDRAPNAEGQSSATKTHRHLLLIIPSSVLSTTSSTLYCLNTSALCKACTCSVHPSRKKTQNMIVPRLHERTRLRPNSLLSLSALAFRRDEPTPLNGFLNDPASTTPRTFAGAGGFTPQRALLRTSSSSSCLPLLSVAG